MSSSVEIIIQGHLDPDWADWLEGFKITHLDNDQTALKGVVADQAALYGLIGKLRDLGLKLISVHYGKSPINQVSTGS